MPTFIEDATNQLAASARSSAAKSSEASSGGLAKCQATERCSASCGSVSAQPSRSQALEESTSCYALLRVILIECIAGGARYEGCPLRPHL
jgi:hypothetical protein